jgi:hypothetical protein
MRNRLLRVLVVSAVPLTLLACKGAGPQHPPQSATGELQTVSPGANPTPQEAVPKGKGMLTVLVLNEGGIPVEGADIRVANRKGETYKTKSRKDGTTKGAGLVSEGPYTVNVMLAGYEDQLVRGIALGESQPVFITIKLQRVGK